MIRYAHSGDLEQIRNLWEICFPDESGFNDYYFANLFELEYVLLYIVDDRIAAMTQMIPYEIRLSADQTEYCTYIYGACTHPAYRRQHLMSKLLERSFVLDRSLGRKCSVLIPAEPWLFEFYQAFGYQPVFHLHTVEKNVEKNQDACLSMLSKHDASWMNMLYEEQFDHSVPHLFRSKSEWMKQIEMFRAIGLGCFGLSDADGRMSGYAFAWRPDGDTLYVQEVAAKSETEKRILLEAIGDYAGVQKIKYSDFEIAADNLGCMRRYDNLEISNAYMNLMMN